MDTTEQTPAGVLRGRHDRGSRESALLEAATTVFAEHGYDAATTAEIARRAGCAEGLIHRYFGGKRGLLLAVIESRQEELVHVFESSLPEAGSLADVLRGVLEWQFRVIAANDAFLKVCVGRAIVDPDIGRRWGEGVNNRLVESIARRLRREREVGRIRPDADVEAVAAALGAVGFVGGFFGLVVFGMDLSVLQQPTAGLVEVLARGLTSVDEEA